MEERLKMYASNSESGRAIADAIGVNTTDFASTPYRCVNWGCGTDKKVRRLPVEWLNTREAVDIASDKVKAIVALHNADINVPDYTFTKEDAVDMFGFTTDKVYCRTLTKANQGRGIIICGAYDELPTAKLYTKAVDYDREYRVHVFKGEVIGVQRKVPHPEWDEEDINYEIRNHANGWFFSKRDIARVHKNIKAIGVMAVNALGLDFGAVDIAWNTRTQVATVFEVNTAPSLDVNGSLFDEYVNRMANWLDGIPAKRDLDEILADIRELQSIAARTFEVETDHDGIKEWLSESDVARYDALLEEWNNA